MRYGKGVALAVALCSIVVVPTHVVAQRSGPGVSGVVVDSSTSAPVRGAFLTFGPRGPRAIADSLGRFTFPSAPSGNQTLTVQAFGYRDLTAPVRVSDASGALSLRMSPEPFSVEGIEVAGGIKTSFMGTVVDAKTGQRLSGARLWLTADAVRGVEDAGSDEQGIFRIRDVPPGNYLLRTELVGYESQFLPISVDRATAPTEVRLDPDTVVQKGIAKLNRDMKSRRNMYPSIARAYGPEYLSYTAAPSAFQFVMNETALFEVSCPPGSFALVCVSGRGGAAVGLRLFLDELPIIFGADMLKDFQPRDFYAIEVFGRSCVRAYTHEFVEKRARRPRLLIPDC